MDVDRMSYDLQIQQVGIDMLAFIKSAGKFPTDSAAITFGLRTLQQTIEVCLLSKSNPCIIIEDPALSYARQQGKLFRALGIKNKLNNETPEPTAQHPVKLILSERAYADLVFIKENTTLLMDGRVISFALSFAYNLLENAYEQKGFTSPNSDALSILPNGPLFQNLKISGEAIRPQTLNIIQRIAGSSASPY